MADYSVNINNQSAKSSIATGDISSNSRPENRAENTQRRLNAINSSNNDQTKNKSTAESSGNSTTNLQLKTPQQNKETRTKDNDNRVESGGEISADGANVRNTSPLYSSSSTKELKEPNSNLRTKVIRFNDARTTRNNSENNNSCVGNNNKSAVTRPASRSSGSNANASTTVNSQTTVGFDNSDKNTTRPNLGSCTDQVAQERPNFGAWQEPNLERQKRLVERLAPYRPPAPPDPTFNTWINHFEYYTNIGANQKHTRRKVDDSYRSNLSRNGYNYQYHNLNEDQRYSNSSPSFSEGFSQHQRYRQSDTNRLLAHRPHTTSGRLRGSDSVGQGGAGGEMDSARKTPRGGVGGVRMTQSSTGDRTSGSPYMTSSGHARRTQRSKSDGHVFEPAPVVSGLDRRYMGLQSVREDELRDIVGRLTRMTSAYNAKFAPNPHVWCDNSPGAHMVAIRRENTIA